jgi:uncharacterized membrane protein
MIRARPPAMHAPDHDEAARSSRLIRARIRLTSALWLPVLVANALAVALALGLPEVDERLDGEHVPIAVSAAQQMLAALAAGMITFTGIIFSAVFVAAQIQTSSYSPRLAARLRRDPVVIAGLAFPTATATYAMFALAAVGRRTGSRGDDFVPAATIVLALLLLVVTLGVFVALVQRAFELTQIGGIFRGLMRRAAAVIDDVHPAGTADTASVVPIPMDPDAEVVRHDGRPAVIAAIDRAALIRLARASGGFVEVLPLVGQYLAPGTATLRVHGARAPLDPAAAARVLILARQRTIDQDPAFVIRMLVDIAIRALSPAVNDPTTAVQSLDRIETLLLDLHRRRPGPTLALDRDGTARGLVPAPTWADYMQEGLTEVRHYGAGSIQVARRLNALYDRLLGEVDEAARPRLELERRLLHDAVALAFPDAEERALLVHSDALGLGARRASGTASAPTEVAGA